jgi:hypothetical protein
LAAAPKLVVEVAGWRPFGMGMTMSVASDLGSGRPPETGGWRVSALHALNEAKGAASLSLIPAVALSLAGHGHGWEQWLSLSGVVIWAALRKTRVF